MTFEHNLSIFIDQHQMRDSGKFVHLLSKIVLDDVVFQRSPSFGIDMIYNLIWIVFNADTNDLDIRAPFFSIGVHHLLVMSHWSLAWWAPGGPKINQPNLSLLMLQELILLGLGKIMLLTVWAKFGESWNSPILSELLWNH